jgi:hypothetical protein
MPTAKRAAEAGQSIKRSTRNAPVVVSADDALTGRTSAGRNAPVDAERQHVLRAQEQWLDLIADLIVQDLRAKESRDADALRTLR